MSDVIITADFDLFLLWRAAIEQLVTEGIRFPYLITESDSV